MIDLKTLAEDEEFCSSESERLAKCGHISVLLKRQEEILRIAMRYLALRHKIANDRHFDLLLEEENECSIDAAADRLIQEMLK